MEAKGPALTPSFPATGCMPVVVENKLRQLRSLFEQD